MSSEKLTGHGVGTGSFANNMTIFPELLATNISIAVVATLGLLANTTKTSAFLTYSKS